MINANAFDILVERGFLTDHGRSLNSVRRFTLTLNPVPQASQRTAPSD